MAKNLLAKVVFAGDGGVGKTTLVTRFLTDHFLEDTRMTIGVAFYIHPMTYNDQQFKLQIWDLGGQGHLQEMGSAYFIGAAVTVTMFDLSNAKTIKNIPEWVKKANANNEEPPKLILIGGKKDLEVDPQIDQESLQQLFHEHNFDSYFEVSSKTKESVEELFQEIARLAIFGGKVKSLARY